MIGLSAEKLVIFIEHNSLVFYHINHIKLKLFSNGATMLLKGFLHPVPGVLRDIPGKVWKIRRLGPR